jgi:N-acetylmuramic acid 6-phosphate etherase
MGYEHGRAGERVVSERFDVTTEQRNERSTNLDSMSALQVVELMNSEDERVVQAVREVLPQVAQAIELATASLQSDGRIIYLGAGTSGRLGMLDAAECPPTFGVSSGRVVGLVAGGSDAVLKAVEGAEDDTAQCERDLRQIGLSPADTVVGLAASGRTPYVVHGLRFAKSLGCATVAVACTKSSAIGAEADVAIEPVTGPEVLTGSTRLKAGTAQKMILNMISTGSMVAVGKAYQNLMVDVRPTNQKLRARARRIVVEATGCEAEVAERALCAAGGSAKTAIVMVLLGVSRDEAEHVLARSGGRVGLAIAGHG